MTRDSGGSLAIGNPSIHLVPVPENSKIDNGQNKNGDDDESSDKDNSSDRNESSDEEEDSDTEEDSDKEENEEPANGYRGLRHRLREIGIPYFDKNRVFSCFWPAPSLQATMTSEHILAQLQAYETTEPGLVHSMTLEVLAEKILNHHCKVFAVLILISKGRCIQSVIDARVKDKHLPLRLKDEDPDSKLYTHNRGTVQERRLRVFEGSGWTPVLRQAFFEYQYAFNPHILSFNDEQRTPRHESFDGKVVLPFTDEQAKQRGGYGIVTKVTIPESCHRFDALIKSIKTDNCFARKQLFHDDKKEFKSEADALRRFNGFDNEHMVTLLMTWTLNGTFNLLFPCANHDLEEYWALHPLPIMEAETLLWTSKQIRGIASAIRSIHNPISNSLRVPEDNRYGRHGDLKAENILLFDSPDDPRGILVVADLGLAKLNSILSRSAQSNNRIHCTPRYKPPESDIHGAKITRSYDVWTFGCLLLEWVCWLFQGYENKEQFIENLGEPYPSGSISETFFKMITRGKDDYHVVVHSAVNTKFMELHSDQKCTSYFHDLLFMVEKDMLVVRAESRIDSETMFSRLDMMHQRALTNRAYCYEACKTSRQMEKQEPLVALYKGRRWET